MNILVDETVDENIKQMLENLGLTIEDHEPIPFDAINFLQIYLAFGETIGNQNMLLHIFTYNYIMLSFVYEGQDNQNLNNLRTKSSAEVMAMISSKPSFLTYLLRNYLKILYYPNLYELVTDNLDVVQDLENIEPIIASPTSVTDNLSQYLEELYVVYNASATHGLFDIIIYILRTDEDPFNIYKKYFKSKDSLKAYKPILVQMLYLNGYLYLSQFKLDNYISKDNLKTLKLIQDKIASNDISTLPNDDTLRLLLSAFYYFDINRKKLANSKKSLVDKIKKETRKRVNPLVIFSLFN